MTAKRQWTLITAVVCLLVVAAGYMLLVKPQSSKAASIREQTSGVQSQVQQLQAKLALLKNEQKHLVDEQAKLAAYQAQLPADPQEPTLLRQIQQLADSSHVDLTALNPGNPGPFTPNANLAAAKTPTGTTTTTTTVQGAAPSVAGIAVIPVTMTVTGDYSGLELFLDGIEGLRRSMLVNTFAITSQGQGTGPASAKTVGAGSISVSIVAQVFMAPTLGTVASTSSGGTSTGASGTTTGGASGTAAS